MCTLYQDLHFLLGWGGVGGGVDLATINPQSFPLMMLTEQSLTCSLLIYSGLITYELPQFNSKQAFRKFLMRHRNVLDISNHTLYEEINFYTSNIRIFVYWLYDAIKVSKYGTIWKTLVAYQKVSILHYTKIQNGFAPPLCFKERTFIFQILKGIPHIFGFHFSPHLYFR